MKLPSSGATIETTGARTEVGTALRTVRARGQVRKKSMDGRIDAMSKIPEMSAHPPIHPRFGMSLGFPRLHVFGPIFMCLLFTVRVRFLIDL